MKVKNQQDFWAGLLFLLLGIAFTLAASNQVMGSAAEPGPGYFSVFLGGLMALLGVWVLFSSLTFETDGGNPVGALAWRPLVIVVAAVLLFGVLLPKWGLILTCPLLVGALHLASSDFDWRVMIASAVGTTALAYLVFVTALKVPLPIWP